MKKYILSYLADKFSMFGQGYSKNSDPKLTHEKFVNKLSIYQEVSKTNDLHFAWLQNLCVQYGKIHSSAGQASKMLSIDKTFE